jgi:tripartite-type tricarboxylate transporter receptor subunit TctC
MARAVSDKMSAALGQQIVIENRNAGGSGTVGTREVAHAAPDGYTILLAYTSTLAAGPNLYKNVGYDPRKDFAPGFDATLSYGLVAPISTPRPIIGRLNKELRAALGSDEVRKRIINEGGEPEPTTPEQHAAVIDREETKWSAMIRPAGLQPQRSRCIAALRAFHAPT